MHLENINEFYDVWNLSYSFLWNLQTYCNILFLT